MQEKDYQGSFRTNPKLQMYRCSNCGCLNEGTMDGAKPRECMKCECCNFKMCQ